MLREALIKELSDPESEQGLVVALETRQGRHEPPQAYYSRLRRAYFGTLFLRNLHPSHSSHHLGVLACPRTMNAQQLRDLAQKAYGKQKMASEKSAKTPAVHDFNTQSQGLALEGAQRQDNAKPPPREWNAPSSKKNETPTLVPGLNRGMNAGMDHVDVNAHLDDTGRSHGTSQGLMRIIGRDRGTSQAHLETQEEKTCGNPTETPRENFKLTLERLAQGIDERIHKDSKLTELKLNPRKNQRHHRVSIQKS